MKFNSSHYEVSNYQSLPEAVRTVLVYELIYSDLEFKLSKLKELQNHETNIEIKFEIGQAINAIETKSVDGYKLSQIKDEKLKAALSSPREQIRHKALAFILKHKKTDLLPALREIKKATNDIRVDIVILKLLALNRISNFNEIYNYLTSKDEQILSEVIQILGEIKIQKSMSVLIQFLLHSNANLREKALKLFTSIDHELSFLFVKDMTSNDKPVLRLAAANAIGVIGYENSSELLSNLLLDKDEKVQKKSREVFQKLNLSVVSTNDNDDEVASQDIESAALDLQNLNTSDSRKVASLLSSIGCVGSRDETLIKAIEPYLHNSDDRVRANALETLGRVYKGYDKEKFLTFLNDSNNRVIGNAISILCENNRCPDEYFDDVNKALEDLSSNHGINGCLTVIYCISNCLDERFLPHLSELYISGDNQAAISAYGLLQSWSDISAAAREELSLISNSLWDEDSLEEDPSSNDKEVTQRSIDQEFEYLNFSDSKSAVWNSIAHYLDILKNHQKSLGILFLFLFSFEILQLFLSFIPSLIIVATICSMLSSLIWVFAPLLFVAHLFHLKSDRELTPISLISSLGNKVLGGYIWTLMYLKLVTISGAIAIGTITVIGWFMISGFLLIEGPAQSSLISTLVVGLFLLITYLMFIGMYYFVGFALHHYFFQPNTGFHPIRASIIFVKARWAAIFWGWLITSVIYLILNLSFWFIGYIEAIVYASLALASTPSGIFNTLSQLFGLLSSGTFDMNLLPTLINLSKAFFSTGFSTLICSALKSFIGVTFWCHQFLYFMGFYHYQNWSYPKEFSKK